MALYLQQKFRVPITIYVSQAFKVNDDAGIEFASIFYKNLFLG
jgi:hypothetical protein